MNAQLKNRLQRTALLAVIGLGLGIAVGWMQIYLTPKHTGIAGLSIGGPFTLTDHNGQKVTDRTYAGHYRFVYFGFTSCPDVCPAGLQKIAQAINMLGQRGDKIQMLFITVDPARDIPEVLKTYISQFHPRLIGLTGTQEEVDSVLNSYKIYAAKVKSTNMNDYMMNHSSFIYFIGPDESLLALYRTQDSVDFIAKDADEKIRP